MSSPAPKKVRLTAELPPQAIDALRTLAESRGVTMTEALRQAISTESFLDQRVSKGASLVLEEDGKKREVVFNHLSKI